MCWPIWSERDEKWKGVEGLMRFRKLRIAWSVSWGLACVLLIVLWVRSYWSADTVYMNICGAAAFKTESVKGSLFLIHNSNGPWGISSMSLDEWISRQDELQKFAGSFRRRKTSGSAVPIFATIPHWFPVLLFAGFATAPWLSWRFSLRTLLIAMALVAVVLGLIVWKLGAAN
jgi:hypothetical protein